MLQALKDYLWKLEDHHDNMEEDDTRKTRYKNLREYEERG